MTARPLAALLAGALAAAPLAASAGQGQARAPSASAPAPAEVPAVPQATAATLAPAAAPAAPRAPTGKAVAIPAAPASSGAKPVLTKHAPPGPPPKEAWRGDGRTSSGVAPGVLARAAARTQQAREPKVPAACERPPSRRPPRIECPPTTGQIESVEIDWNAPAAR